MTGGKNVPIYSENFLDRFWNKVIIRTGKCWEWTGTLSEKGYGSIQVGDKMLRAHVVSWCIANDQTLTPDLYVLHRCDNPSCVKPIHLFLGTPQDNTDDMVSKGRDKWVGRPVTEVCKRGHPRTKENSYISYRRDGRKVTACIICRNKWY